MDTSKPSPCITSSKVQSVIDESLMQWLDQQMNETHRAPERQVEIQEDEDGVRAGMLVSNSCQEMLLIRAREVEKSHCVVPSCLGGSCLKP